MFGCSGGDDGPTDVQSLCALPWAGTRTWFMAGGCPATPSSFNSQSTLTFSNCTITMDVTPPAEKTRGATWTLTTNLQTGTAQVVRANTDCPGTDTGSLDIRDTVVVADVTAPADPACACRLRYTISIPRPR